MARADNASAWLVGANSELQWQVAYYRQVAVLKAETEGKKLIKSSGYYELHVTQRNVSAQYFGIPSIVQRLPYEVSLANFTVQ